MTGPTPTPGRTCCDTVGGEPHTPACDAAWRSDGKAFGPPQAPTEKGAPADAVTVEGSDGGAPVADTRPAAIVEGTPADEEGDAGAQSDRSPASRLLDVAERALANRYAWDLWLRRDVAGTVLDAVGYPELYTPKPGSVLLVRSGNMEHAAEVLDALAGLLSDDPAVRSGAILLVAPDFRIQDLSDDDLTALGLTRLPPTLSSAPVAPSTIPTGAETVTPPR